MTIDSMGSGVSVQAGVKDWYQNQILSKRVNGFNLLRSIHEDEQRR